MRPDDKPQQHPNAAWREMDGEVVIISPEDSVLHELNETASWIWKQATGGRSVEQIAHDLAEEYEVEPEVALADTFAILNHLESKKLVAPAEAQG
jgi:hypothetical protein